MLGALIGDIVGSRFEWNNHKSKDFDLFGTGCRFTDDSVMTIAVANALCRYEKITDIGDFKDTLIVSMHEIGNKHLHCGFGGRFIMWLMNRETSPYNSYGNGSAMRVSPVGWYASSLEEAETLAKATAEITHNHPEGIKGAVSVAGAIYLARNGSSMEEIREYVSHFYDIEFTLDEVRGEYNYDVTCQGSVPHAFEAFFESTGFEDAIRNAISVGGDSDTIAAITGSVAEAFYGIDDSISERLSQYLTSEFNSAVKNFCEKYNKGTTAE